MWLSVHFVVTNWNAPVDQGVPGCTNGVEELASAGMSLARQVWRASSHCRGCRLGLTGHPNTVRKYKFCLKDKKLI